MHLEDFAPRDRQTARGIFDLPRDKAVLLFVAASATNHRKGFSVLAEALASLAGRKDVVLCSLGTGQPKIAADIPHLHLGQVDNDRMLSMVYSAADIFVSCRLWRTIFPARALESLACGTPIVASEGRRDTGDAVRPGETGMLGAGGGRGRCERKGDRGVPGESGTARAGKMQTPFAGRWRWKNMTRRNRSASGISSCMKQMRAGTACPEAGSGDTALAEVM